jgi:hypothetical protein
MRMSGSARRGCLAAATVILTVCLSLNYYLIWNQNDRAERQVIEFVCEYKCASAHEQRMRANYTKEAATPLDKCLTNSGYILEFCPSRTVVSF